MEHIRFLNLNFLNIIRLNYEKSFSILNGKRKLLYKFRLVNIFQIG